MNAHHNRLFSLTGIKNMKVSSRRGVHLSGSTLLAFFLLMSIRAAAQVKTMPFDEIRNDTVSFFSNDNYKKYSIVPYMEYTKTDSIMYTFGLTKVIFPRDTFVNNIVVHCCADANSNYNRSKHYRRASMKDIPYGMYGGCLLEAELLRSHDTRIWPAHGDKRIIRIVNTKKPRLLKRKNHFKISAWFPVYGDGTNPVIKCLTADIYFYPLTPEKSTVEYRLEYKKYPKMPEYKIRNYKVYGPLSRSTGIQRDQMELDKATLESSTIYLNYCKRANKIHLNNKKSAKKHEK